MKKQIKELKQSLKARDKAIAAYIEVATNLNKKNEMQERQLNEAALQLGYKENKIKDFLKEISELQEEISSSFLELKESKKQIEVLKNVIINLTIKNYNL